MKPGAPIDHFDAQVAEDLEFDVIRLLLADLAGCPTSEQRAEQLVPSKDRAWVVRTLQETDEMRRIRQGGLGFPHLEFEEIKREIKQSSNQSNQTIKYINQINQSDQSINSISFNFIDYLIYESYVISSIVRGYVSAGGWGGKTTFVMKRVRNHSSR